MDPKYLLNLDVLDGGEAAREWVYFRGPGHMLIPVLEQVLERLRNLQDAVPQPQPWPMYPQGAVRCGAQAPAEHGGTPCLEPADHGPVAWGGGLRIVHDNAHGVQWVDA
jgi:hypothetical protein